MPHLPHYNPDLEVYAANQESKAHVIFGLCPRLYAYSTQEISNSEIPDSEASLFLPSVVSAK